MNRLVCAAVVAMFASAASAQMMPGNELGVLTIDLSGNIVSNSGGHDTIFRNYDNWDPPTAITGVVGFGGAEVADDLLMTPVGVGWLDRMGLSVANTAPAGGPEGNLLGGSGTVRFYDHGTQALIGGFNFNLPDLTALNMGPGTSVRLQFGVGSLRALEIFLPQNIFTSIEYTTGSFSGTGNASNMGVQLRGPVAIGSSTDNLFEMPGFQAFNFNGNPPAMSALYIETDSIPAPGSMALLALAGIAACRRRR